MHSITQNIIKQIRQKADQDKAEWWSKYLKGCILFYGVGIPEIRKILKENLKSNFLEKSSFDEQKTILNELMHLKHTEEKLAAVLFMQMYWKNKITPLKQLELISKWFDNKLIWDWNTCDWLCVRILSPMLKDNHSEILPELERWNKNEYLWKARASLVPFAECNNLIEYSEKIRTFSIELIQREERFAKTAVGWVMRQYSKHNTGFVIRFLEGNKDYLIPEVYKNAMKYID